MQVSVEAHKPRVIEGAYLQIVVSGQHRRLCRKEYLDPQCVANLMDTKLGGNRALAEATAGLQLSCIGMGALFWNRPWLKHVSALQGVSGPRLLPSNQTELLQEQCAINRPVPTRDAAVGAAKERRLLTRKSAANRGRNES